MSETKSIIRLSSDHRLLYERFRSGRWGLSRPKEWKRVEAKYLSNPAVRQVEGGGIYGVKVGGQLTALMGAYPLPLKVDGCDVSGSLLCDWAVHPKYRASGNLARLYRQLQSGTGAVFTMRGVESVRATLDRRGTILPITFRVAVIKPIKTAIFQYLNLGSSVQPVTLEKEIADLEVDGLDLREYSHMLTVEASGMERSVYVRRSSDFWAHHYLHRELNGSVDIRFQLKDGFAVMRVRFVQVGDIRLCQLLAYTIKPDKPSNYKEAGRLLRTLLWRLGVCAVRGSEPTQRSRILLSKSGYIASTTEKYYWRVMSWPSSAPPLSKLTWQFREGDAVDTIW